MCDRRIIVSSALAIIKRRAMKLPRSVLQGIQAKANQKLFS